MQYRTQKKLFTSTDHGADFKWGISGGGRIEYHYYCIILVIIWDPNKGMDIREWLICRSGRLQKFYCYESYAIIMNHLNEKHKLCVSEQATDHP